MSLNSLASTRVAREAEGRARVRALSSSSEDAVGPKEEDVQNALSALVEYVPAETITLYLATVSSLPVLTAAVPTLDALTVYIVFAAFTPALFALIYAGKRRAAGESRWPGGGCGRGGRWSQPRSRFSRGASQFPMDRSQPAMADAYSGV